MTALPDPARRLDGCPLVIFIAYTIPDDAEARGYADWLRRVDMPFFNGIPGVHHYANWRLTEILAGAPPVWDWFDFQGLAAEDDLERVWFDPGLDDFRANWLKLWGYGEGGGAAGAAALLRHPPGRSRGARQRGDRGGAERRHRRHRPRARPTSSGGSTASCTSISAGATPAGRGIRRPPSSIRWASTGSRFGGGRRPPRCRAPPSRPAPPSSPRPTPPDGRTPGRGTRR
jgi:hypothetical protein